MSNRVALITGSSRGIGFSIAERLVEDGWQVAITGRTAATLEESVAHLGTAAVGFAGKADDPVHQEAAVAGVVEAFGRLDLLVNNAGINPVYGPLMDVDIGAARKVFEVNVVSSLRWSQLAYHAWMETHGGCIVNVASVTGLTAARGLGVYGTSKAALIALTRQLGDELGPKVRVNAVAPAVIKTDFSRALYEGNEEAVVATYPLGRLGTPQDVAGAVSFLASEDAEWITGQTIVVDGGLTLGGKL
ncbi:MAG TPA: 3-oxoacyl-ACP reductase [Actinobacteria bacterium]|jgi:NAD(P)-dependent dehydrogenase (short-subunit alcohol dehydrogenase family)|nr:3-oxoacyl-ACP reductase [Actinomycetota bacterium]